MDIVVSLKNSDIESVSVYKKGLKTGLDKLQEKNDKFYLEEGIATAIIIKSKKSPSIVTIRIGKNIYSGMKLNRLSSSEYLVSFEDEKMPFLYSQNKFLLNIVNYDYNLFFILLIIISVLFWAYSYHLLVGNTSKKSLFLKINIVLFLLSSILSVLLNEPLKVYLQPIYLLIVIFLLLSGAPKNGDLKK